MAVVKKQSNVISSTSPASWWGETWREGLFIGNGVIGANVFGGAASEKILLNHADLTWQGRIQAVPDVSSKLREVRSLIEDNQFADAADVYKRTLAVSKHFHPQHFYPLPMCVLNASCRLERPAKEYLRTLNMSTAEVNVSFLDAQSRVNRSCFISRDNDTFVYEITKTGTSKQLDYEFSFDIPDSFNNSTINSISNMPQGVRVSYDRFFMYFTARADDGGDYGCVARLNHYGGSLSVTDRGIKITGANSIILYLRTFVKGNCDKEFTRLRTELTAIKDTYDKLLKPHVTKHQALFGSATISFDNSGDEPLDVLLDNLKKGDCDSAIIEKVYKYARFLFVCCTNEQGRLFSPYGLWGASYKAYRAVLPLSGPMQEVYDFALQGNMLSLADSLFSFVFAHIDEFIDNAVRLFGCVKKGVYVPTICSSNTGRLGAIDAEPIHFTGCAGYLARLMQEYYLLTGDVKFYKSKALPFMCQVAQFYDEYLFNSNGVLNSSPSCLPLSTYTAISPNEAPLIAKNAYIDYEICAEVLRNLLSAAEELNIYADKVSNWNKLLAALPCRSVDANGVLRDFLMDNAPKTTDVTNNSTLFSVAVSHYGDNADEQELTEQLATAKKKFELSCEAQNGYNLSVLATIFAKMGQKKLANDCIYNVLRGCAMNNLALNYADWRGMGVCGNETWAPMQLQNNIVLANAIQRMILSSVSNGIVVLPAYPEQWGGVKAEGLLSYGGTITDIVYNAAKGLLNVDIKAKKAVTLAIYLPDGVKRMVKSNLKVTYNADTNVISDVELAKGKVVSLQFAYRPVK